MKISLVPTRPGLATGWAQRFVGAVLLAGLVLPTGSALAAPDAPVVGQVRGAVRPTDPSVACSPRPRVVVRSEMAVLPEIPGLPGQDALAVTVTPTGVGNGIRAIRFTATANALVSVVDSDGHPAPYGVTFPAGTEPARLGFTLWRPDRAQSSFARVVVTDACGEWSTFVGRGAGPR